MPLKGEIDMPLKVRNDQTAFLKSRDTMKKSEGADKDHKYIISMKPLDKMTGKEKLSIFSDSMFKTMFANENRKKYACKLLSYILDISYEELLKTLQFGKNELDKRKEREKGERADFVAYVNNSAIDIEINSNDKVETLERNIEYMNRLYSKLVEKGEQYDYRQSLLININNFAYKGKEKIKYVCYLKDSENEALTDKLIVVQIYIPNLVKKWYTSGVEKLTEEERYLLTLAIPEIETALEIGKDHVIMEEYINEAIEVSKNAEIRDSYRKEWDLLDQGYRDGKEQGIEEGRKEGRKEGRREGKLEGRAEKQIEIAKEMLKEKLDMSFITKIVGISKEELEKLAHKINIETI